jgi:ABC-type lipoprotein release transport system permease subunit
MVVGVWAMVFFSAFMRGMMTDMVRQTTVNLTGHVQIQAPGYFDNPVIENRITDFATVAEVVKNTLPSGALATARLRTGALIRSSRGALGATLVGIVPGEEVGVSFVGSAKIEGEGLESNRNGVMVGRALAEKLETRIGHRIVIDAQNANGQIVSRAFKIVGIFRGQMEAVEKQFVFCNRADLQEMLGVGDNVSEFSIVLPDVNGADALAAELRKKLPDETHRVLTWGQMVSFMNAYIESMDMYALIWNLVVFVAMAFGLVNSILMAVFERVREFGLIRALGVTPLGVVGSVLVETTMLLILGLIAGCIVSEVTVLFLGRTGIDFSSFSDGSEYFGISRIIYPMSETADYVRACLTVVVLGIFVSLYPAIKAARITPVQAMLRH